ncbi:long-chain fatty acid--CoA ligase [Streptomyces tremellae]|uniref:Long-chain fatty acid--CoA ligase n=1 Tax=Streptomyces tremellae TaxID=1124239 RepID=A0ABP7FAQ2_9ACTN
MPAHARGTYASCLAAAHRRFARRDAFVAGPGAAVGFAEAERRAASVVGGLRALGLRPGARVVIALENDVRAMLAERAVMLWGITRVGVSARMHPLEVAHVVADSGASVLLCEDRHADGLPADLRRRVAVVARDSGHSTGPGLAELCAGTADPGCWPGATPDSAASLMYTSGTTGRPKGAVNSQAAWASMAGAVASFLPPVAEGDVLLHAAPFAHFSGSVGAAYATRGGAYAALPKFEPAALADAVERVGATCLPLVPTMLADLVRAVESGAARVPRGLRAVPYGGSTVSPRTVVRARELLGDVLVQFYGASEALIPTTVLSRAAHRDLRADAPAVPAGVPGPGTRLRLREPRDGVGEIEVRGPRTMSGYWGDRARTGQVLGADGWLATGDAGRLGPGRVLFITGRTREVIISGGFNVYPAEVERVIDGLPQVAESAVFAVPHERWGECVAAAVAPRPGRTVTPESVVAACGRELASYKKPVLVEIVERLPRTSTGKVDRRALSRSAAKRSEQSA